MTTRGPTQGSPELLARRTFRHRATGHEVVLLVERQLMGGDELRWRVIVQDTPGSPAWVVKLPGVSLHGTLEAARRGFVRRQRALRAGGYERMD